MKYVHDNKVYTLRQLGKTNVPNCDDCVFNWVRLGREVKPQCDKARTFEEDGLGCNGYIDDTGARRGRGVERVWMTDAEYALWRLTK